MALRLIDCLFLSLYLFALSDLLLIRLVGAMCSKLGFVRLRSQNAIDALKRRLKSKVFTCSHKQ